MTDGVGTKLREIRKARGKSLAVVSGLAGISPSYLSRLESGDRALDRRSLIAALADALEVAPSEITGASLAQEASEDRALSEVRLTLLAVSMGEPRGHVLPVDPLRTRVDALLTAQRRCEYALVGAQLPSLLRDLHQTLFDNTARACAREGRRPWSSTEATSSRSAAILVRESQTSVCKWLASQSITAAQA